MWASVALMATDNQALAFLLGSGALIATAIAIRESDQ
jgi:hypothetical protein